MLYIVRGLPGSGKSTFAKTLGCFHVEADMFFIKNRKYTFNKDFVGQAHDWCFRTVEEALAMGLDVVVSNTFTTRREVERYVVMATKYGRHTIYRMMEDYGNTHDVPQEALDRMKNRIVDIDGEIKI